ncbi:hypothetical protein GZH47_24925 [Paenibacillus rhizovicinus]|uniref:DUF3221 domain-containing protein n=1 Tax=Paenibacillus rhizovicinus TaxID=2704463 RepID=A0A6C0P5D3_9BACL|nr:hypothetical protein [Paenibacillus rhizovicinus]QHW33719.1 hypothetical protein GZH47_24925 [Paenibacillus rhizovicinus]
MRQLWAVMAVFVLLLMGCGEAGSGGTASINSEATHNPTAQEMLQDNPDADFFQLGDVIYVNAANIEWVQAEALKAEEKIDSIAKQYVQGGVFEDGMATKLPKGAEIYKPDTHGLLILIAKWDGHEVRYLAILEG